MSSVPKLVFAVLLVALSACANPGVDTSAPTFDDTRYSVDLNTCRGGSALNAALHGFGGAVVGSALGAVEGAYHGAIAGDAPEGTIIGAVAGSVVGFALGAYKPINELDQKVRRCLSGKGYRLDS